MKVKFWYDLFCYDINFFNFGFLGITWAQICKIFVCVYVIVVWYSRVRAKLRQKKCFVVKFFLWVFVIEAYGVV